MEELTSVLTISKDVGVAIVIVIFGYLALRVIVTGAIKVVDIWTRVALSRQEIDNKRNEIDDKMAAAVLAFSASQVRLENKTDTTNTLISDSALQSRTAHLATQTAVGRVESTMGIDHTKGEAQRNEIAQGVASNSAKLDDLKQALTDLSEQITKSAVGPEIIKAVQDMTEKLDEFIAARAQNDALRNKPEEA